MLISICLGAKLSQQLSFLKCILIQVLFHLFHAIGIRTKTLNNVYNIYLRRLLYLSVVGSDTTEDLSLYSVNSLYKKSCTWSSVQRPFFPVQIQDPDPHQN